MTTKEYALAALLLQMAADEFGNHGCNDFDEKLMDSIGFTDKQKIELAREYHSRNGDLEECEPVTTQDFYRIGDSSWMWLMAQKLAEEDGQ